MKLALYRLLLWLGPLLTFACSTAPALAVQREVTAANLAAQILAAADGDVLKYSGDFAPALLKNKKGLTIIGGRFTKIEIRTGARLTFVDTVIIGTPEVRHSPLLNILPGSADIRFDGLKITATPRADGARLGYAIKLIGGERITFAGLEVSGTTKAMVAGSTKGLRVYRAKVYDLQSDGFQVGNLDGAEFIDIDVGQLNPAPGDHPDGFQGLSGSKNLTIRNFRMYGAGVGDGQGIFLSDAVYPARYTGIVVENVNIANKFGRCVSIDQADGVRLRNIVCISRPGFTDRAGIQLFDVTGLDASDTVACTQGRNKVSGVELRSFTFNCTR